MVEFIIISKESKLKLAKDINCPRGYKKNAIPKNCIVVFLLYLIFKDSKILYLSF